MALQVPVVAVTPGFGLLVLVGLAYALVLAPEMTKRLQFTASSLH